MIMQIGNSDIFLIKDTKLYVPVVTSSRKCNQISSKLLSKWFERLVYWNEYRWKKCEKKYGKSIQTFS